MPVRPPSLRAIAAFEAAARHESFTKAADELNLTQSAISHAIRSLELRLGVDLFDRFGRTVALTEAGRTFVSRLRLSLNLISEAFETPARPGRARLVIAATAGIAERILANRLPGFLAGHPDRELELRTVTGAAEVSAGEVDVAILYGAGACAGLTQRRLAGEALFPVAAPAVDLPRRPEDLVHAPLIHQPEHPWRMWLEQVGLSDLPTHATLTADSPLAALELARNGAGICLARGLLVREDLRAGRLVRLFDAEATLREDYTAVWNPASPRADVIRPFVDWLADGLDAGPAAAPALHAA
ncbi:MAG: LysR family transcriptional regulator [Alphaproteobacteria bacterium]|nr:LysR family transcriptional regulator [Alphaproteobacteria bacterium]MBU1517124.1 LysR family transcriptional regulator [Alphaproteobacteria bacterium]MBU2093743.1 LysR family transcriptional regulator [Alphaproteobacteria bacterium]MBU2153935.1 LysR family transcriptional regulator [Alphaproteobacteria bacterium]MBU2308657.1 LysR family transcriptional regulator [Alphaproteobacteria bacterium]